MNQLFQQLQPVQQPVQQPPQQGNMMQHLQSFIQGFRGDPKQMVQQLMQSGKVSQAQYNQAVQMANMLTGRRG